MTPELATSLALIALDGAARARVNALRDAKGSAAALDWLARLDARIAPLVAAQDAKGVLAVAEEVDRGTNKTSHPEGAA